MELDTVTTYIEVYYGKCKYFVDIQCAPNAFLHSLVKNESHQSYRDSPGQRKVSSLKNLPSDFNRLLTFAYRLVICNPQQSSINLSIRSIRIGISINLGKSSMDSTNNKLLFDTVCFQSAKSFRRAVILLMKKDVEII